MTGNDDEAMNPPAKVDHHQPPPPSPASTVAEETAPADGGPDLNLNENAPLASENGTAMGEHPPPSRMEMKPPPAAPAISTGPSPPKPPSSSSSSTTAATHHEGVATVAALLKRDNVPRLAASTSAFQPISSPAHPPTGNSSGSETEHLPSANAPPTSTASMPSSSSAAAMLSTSSAKKDNNHTVNEHVNDRSLARLRSTKSANPPSHQSCISRPSSLSSKSRGSQSSRPRPHAYFASSEEESEAELDERDSHSSRDNNRASSHGNYGHAPRHVAGSLGRKSSMRGSKKLAEIASKVGGSSGHHAHLHSSRVRMTIPAGHKESGGGKPLVPSIYKTAPSDRGAVPPPPQTVTVAVGKGPDGQGTVNILPSPLAAQPPAIASSGPRGSRAMPAAMSASAALSSPGVPPVGLSTYATSPTRKRIRKKKRRSHRHLPRGLPVFKDPRSCMWTSTHDANAPSEDRYSSLVNVLLRPPKTPRGGLSPKKKCENENNNGNSNNNGGGSQSGSSCDGSSEESGDAADSQQTATAGTTQQTASGTTKTNTTSPANNSTEDDEDNTSLIRLSLWSVIDGHGGGCVATYAAEVLLPHIAASVARALKSEIVDRGVCNVNGQLRDANALDLDGLIRSSDRSRHVGKSQVRQREAGIDVVNPNSIHYRSPYEDSESEVEEDHASRGTQSRQSRDVPGSVGVVGGGGPHSDGMRSESESEAESEAPVSVASSLLPGNPITHGESVSSVKTSVKTAVSPVTQHAPVGTHSPAEVAAITRAITDSFLAVDEGWINSIDPVTTHQTSCVSNGRWNAGACALVVFIVQRLDWCRSSRVDNETHQRERSATGFDDTSHNKDAARRRKLDYATKSKSVSSLSTLSSTSSITTEANTTETLAEESEITETEDDDDVSDIFGPRRRRRKNHRGGGHHHHHHHRLHDDDDDDDPHHREGVFIATPAACKCHYYRPNDAMLYTAHVGDCRAVMLGSAPPRTIKVPPEGKDSGLSLEWREDESSSESIVDEISSSEHDSDSSGDMMDDGGHHFIHRARGSRSRGNRSRTHHNAPGESGAAPGMLGYVRRASKRQRRNEKSVVEPFVPLPPLNRRDSSSEESAVESDDSASTTADGHIQEPPPPVGSIVRTTGPRGVLVDHGVALPSVGVRSVVGPRGVEVVDRLLETEDEEAEDDEIKEIRSVRSGSPTQMDRPPSPTQLVVDPVHPPPLPLSMLMRPIDLTTDHSAYNPAEVTAVLRRCNNAPKAISSASGGGIKRVAGSLAVTRALGDAYLKTPRLSFFPYKRHAPYITARPEVNCRVLTKGADRILTLASDGVWERASGDDVLRWVRNYYNARIAGVKEQHLRAMYDDGVKDGMDMDDHHDPYVRDFALEKGTSRRKLDRLGASEGAVLGGNNSENELASNQATASSGEMSSEDDTPAVDKAEELTPPVDNTAKKTAEEDSILSSAHNEAKEESDAATSETTAATTTADETTATSTAKAGTKRKHSSPSANATVDDSMSSRSASTAGSSRGGGGGGVLASLSRHHLHSSRPYSLAIPTVSEVIVRKVLNKVRKTRNISSLRMLMSLPKGRARRSKHDDITATVVDLSGFVS